VTLRVAFVARAAPEEDAAWAWLEGRQGITARRYPLTAIVAAADAADVVWVHASAGVLPVGAAALTEAAGEGRGILLTLAAADLVVAMGIEPNPPNDIAEGRFRAETDEYWTGDFRRVPAYPHVRGLATWGPHPLVDGLHNGTYCWAPSDGEHWVRCGYVHGLRPAGGEVVAVERAYIAQNADRVVAWEYALGRGRVLCIGAFVHFAAPDPLLRPQLERLIANALAALTAVSASPRPHWPPPATAAVPADDLPLPEPLDLDGPLPDPATDPLALAGIGELWAHPHRLSASWDVSADGAPALAAKLAVTPDVVVRTLDAGATRMVETVFVALEHALAVVEYAPARRGRASVGRGPSRLEVRLTVDLRRMWPFPAGCAGNLRFRRSAHGLVAVVTTEADEGTMALFTSRPAEIVMRAVHGTAAPLVEIVIAAPLGVPLRLAVAGATTGDELAKTLRAVERVGVAGLVRQRAQRAQTVREARVSLHAADERLPKALEWAKRRLDLFVGDVPAVGRSLLAGYAASRPGWNEARPGYAWFFGRDACWSAFALLAAGEHSLPRQVIRFLGDRQDVTGKVLHEATTSGQFHYDAADSTPLYLLLVARYLQWTGDRDFVRSVWPHVERALAFCLSTDTDGDGLIENARVGHGWTEGGPLGGAQVTLYLASVWRAALAGVARAADVLGEDRMAADCWARAARAGDAIDTVFHDDRRAAYALDRRRDGTRAWTQTALHAVPLVVGAIASHRMARWLDEVAGEGFSAPWGVRMIAAGDRHYDPQSYHGGSVWPLFTGWAALAEYRAGRPDAGFRHLAANARHAFERQLGAFDEALHGGTGASAGVCADQAWSAAAVIAPVVEGMLGAEPDAPGGRLTLAPSLPEGWGWMALHGLRCGETVLDVRTRRRGPRLSVRIRRTLGPPLWLTLAAWAPSAGCRMLVDEQPVRPTETSFGALVKASVGFQASGEHEVVMETVDGSW
jgi:hypothetical protein